MAITINGSGTVTGLSAGGISNANAVASAAMPAGSILQVVQAFKSDYYTRTSDSTATDIPGLTQAITLTSASNKVFAMANIQITSGGNYGGHVLHLVRGSTKIAQATDAGSRTVGTLSVSQGDTYARSHVINYVDTPGAGTHTYRIQDQDNDGTNNAIYINATQSTTDASHKQRSTSTLILMEIAV